MMEGPGQVPQGQHVVKHWEQRVGQELGQELGQQKQLQGQLQLELEQHQEQLQQQFSCCRLPHRSSHRVEVQQTLQLGGELVATSSMALQPLRQQSVLRHQRCERCHCHALCVPHWTRSVL